MGMFKRLSAGRRQQEYDGSGKQRERGGGARGLHQHRETGFESQCPFYWFVRAWVRGRGSRGG